MRSRWQAWHVALLLVILCVGVAGFFFWKRSRSVPSLSERVQRLPLQTNTAAYVDLAVLRSSGLLDLLTGRQIAEEPDYRKFAESTGFNYREDLDTALIAFDNQQSVYVLATGRFDWAQLKEHTEQNGGQCRNGVCRMSASTPRRYISYVPLSARLLAMAVANDEWAVERLRSPQPGANLLPEPDAPIWIAARGSAFTTSSLPAGTTLFAKALSSARLVTLGFHGTNADSVEARLVAECASDADAAALSNQLSGVTDVFKKYMNRVNQPPNPADLSGVLTAGSFEAKSNIVSGRWPIGRSFLDALASGKL